MIKPILFNREMVKAILEGWKTVTRRALKPQPEGRLTLMTANSCYPGCFAIEGSPKVIRPPCQPDDVLWVRETWCESLGQVGKYFYRAYAGQRDEMKEYAHSFNHWRPSIHMPREAARLFLRVIGVRAERLQDISAKQAHMEGQPRCDVGITICGGPRSCYDCEADTENAVRWFAGCWDSTIKPADCAAYGWEANPWVWVIEFERCEKPEGWPR